MKRFIRKDNTRYGKRHVPGVMNKTEEEYAEILQARRLTGEVIRFDFESMTFKLAKDCRYTPDFSVWLADGSMQFIDCKGAGPMDEKSRVKAKLAAELFPQFVFIIEQKQAKKNGGGWVQQVF